MNLRTWQWLFAVRECFRTAGSWRVVSAGLGMLLILLGTLVLWHKSAVSGDDFPHFYVLARAVADGRDLYSVATSSLPSIYREYLGFDYHTPWAVFSPPSIALALAPFVRVSYPVAEVLWFWLMWFVLLVGVFRLTVYFAPAMPASTRLVLAGLVLCTSAVRWGFFQLQAAPLILGTFGLFLAPGRWGATWLPFAVAAWVTCLKVTMGAPFVAIAILQRRYWIAFGAITVFLLANTIGFVRIGGWDSVEAYRQDIAALEVHGNDPNPWNPHSVSRIDWQYLLNALHPNRQVAMVLSVLLTFAGLCIIVWSAGRCRPSQEDAEGTALFLGPIVTLSMLAVYHHHYDSAVLLAPVVGYLFGQRYPLQAPGSRWFVIVILLYAGVFPYGYAHHWAYTVGGDGGLVAAKALGSFVTVFAFCASVVALLHYVAREKRCRMLAEAQ